MSEEARAEADAGPVTRRRSRRRVPFQPRQILMLAIIWLVLVGEVNIVSVVGGLDAQEVRRRLRPVHELRHLTVEVA